jgi:hypothetical protein
MGFPDRIIAPVQDYRAAMLKFVSGSRPSRPQWEVAVASAAGDLSAAEASSRSMLA